MSEDKSQKIVEALQLYLDAEENALQVLKQALPKLDKTQPSPAGKPSEPDHHSEIYEKLNWEDRTSDRGPFQMIRKGDCTDTHLFNHLDNIVRANKGNISIGTFHYWVGDSGYIFRRKKKNSKQ